MKQRLNRHQSASATPVEPPSIGIQVIARAATIHRASLCCVARRPPIVDTVRWDCAAGVLVRVDDRGEQAGDAEDRVEVQAQLSDDRADRR